MSSSLIGRPIHSALCHIKAKTFVNYYTRGWFNMFIGLQIKHGAYIIISTKQHFQILLKSDVLLLSVHKCINTLLEERGTTSDLAENLTTRVQITGHNMHSHFSLSLSLYIYIYIYLCVGGEIFRRLFS